MKPVKDSFAGTPQFESASHPDKTDAHYWKSRLIRRRYTEAIKRVRGAEYSTRIEHGGVSYFFPLGSPDEGRAVTKAVEIYTTVVNEGWPVACKRFPREFTVAVFWGWNPMACTYTTLYSMPAVAPFRLEPGRQRPKHRCRVSIIESEDAVRRALAFWIDRQPGFQCAQAFSTVKQAIHLVSPESTDLVLVKRDLVEQPGGEKIESIKERVARVPVFSFGIYEESNYIFHSVTGVSSGYFLRRQPPAQLFDPISQLARQPELSPKLLARQIGKYFQDLFDPTDHKDAELEWTNLTDREHEILICLSKGLSDKQIADALNISVWTVHGHVKKVFEKLGVHSRTEAVVKFLQK